MPRLVWNVLIYVSFGSRTLLFGSCKKVCSQLILHGFLNRLLFAESPTIIRQLPHFYSIFLCNDHILAKRNEHNIYKLKLNKYFIKKFHICEFIGLFTLKNIYSIDPINKNGKNQLIFSLAVKIYQEHSNKIITE